MPDPKTKDIIVRVFDLYLEGKRHQTIANIFNKENVCNKNWYDSTINMDEKTPHLHCVVVPLIKKYDKRSNTEKWTISKEHYMKDKYHERMISKGYDLDRGIKNSDNEQNDIYDIAHDTEKESELLAILPDEYSLSAEYPEFVTYYRLKIKDIQILVEKLDANLDVSQFMGKINELLKIQELFYQKYKGSAKKEITDELVFKSRLNK